MHLEVAIFIFIKKKVVVVSCILGVANRFLLHNFNKMILLIKRWIHFLTEEVLYIVCQKKKGMRMLQNAYVLCYTFTS